MRPIVMKGHRVPLTCIKYNEEGDLLFSCAKDNVPCVWFADNGEHLGVYRGHNGVVWSCDVSGDSRLLITGSADQTVRLWNVQNGKQLYSFNFDSPARSVDFSFGDRLALITTDPFNGRPSSIQMKQIAGDPDGQTGESLLRITGPSGKIPHALWGPLNETIISSGEDATIRIWDSETGKLLRESDEQRGHQELITSLKLSADGAHILSGSFDKSAKLWDRRTLTPIKSYVIDRPVMSCALSPLLDHVAVGNGMVVGGILAAPYTDKNVTRFFHMVSGEEIGCVKGHSAPVTYLAFNPDGRSFASAGEDGYIRLHHFDEEYYTM